MNLIETFQDLVAQVPELIQPLVVALAGAVPFIEGEGAASIGIIGGINPVVAAVAAIVGNFLCVAVLVIGSAGARQAIVTRRDRARNAALVGSSAEVMAAEQPVDQSPRREKFQRALSRYGVPGVSLLGPLLLPTQFTATMLAAAGVGKARILFWQALAIVGWTTLLAVIIGSAVHAVG
ncbi:MAG: small multidrug efflux protein [Leucobacter sp.]